MQRTAATILALALCSVASAETLTGHGGPVMGLDVAPDGRVATASFDNSVGLWANGSPRWLEGHAAAVNAVLFTGPETLASAADDFDVLRWRLDAEDPERLDGHEGKVMGLAAAGSLLASASWDGTIGLWPADGAPRFLDGHDGPVNAVAFTPDGGALYSASADGTIREWDPASGAERRTLVDHGFGVNEIVLAQEAGWLAYGAVDGAVRVVDLQSGEEIADLSAGRRPILALERAPDRSVLAVGDGEGYILVADAADWSVRHDFRATDHGPIWALGFAPSGATLYAAGLDSAVHIWPLANLGDAEAMPTGAESFLRDPDTMSNGERQFQRKCSICHTLSADGGRRAGPPLGGLFGRPAGSVEGYRYSDALAESDVVWTAESIDALFDEGPDHYVPGTKMPMQRIARPEDRADLVAFLRRATE
ncbi:Cytochrome c2 precursor [Roseivivax jejudonensis]|uniref:Cytochrome c2 n=1 Tax=Roseivivax jejudonensis TaxID=1529041 RepID=A0A1X7A833_9RHOB|nr:c-type cytochrome [Roseivivax jejudonensis]SLN72630.1 Cytochrome c2 precursor [Roseivivax jejudonensis]